MNFKLFKQLFLFVPIFFFVACQNNNNIQTLLVGTYTNTGSKGIYAYRFNTNTLQMELLSETLVEQASYLTVSKDGNYVYAVSEAGANSFVNAFTFDKASGKLDFINKIPVDNDPCYVWVDDANRFVATANYSGGSVSVIPIIDGALQPSNEVYYFHNSSSDSTRQRKSHIHCVVASPDRKYLFATDLGGDKVYSFNINSSDKAPFLTLLDSLSFPQGSGPRHLTFNAKGDKAYLINELSGYIIVMEHLDGTLTGLQSILADTCYARGSADIHLSPDGQYLYASTRHQGDGIVIFKVDDEGLLTKTGYQATKKHPRNFTINNDGTLLLVGSKDDNEIQIFNINTANGSLKETPEKIYIQQPVCLSLLN